MYLILTDDQQIIELAKLKECKIAEASPESLLFFEQDYSALDDSVVSYLHLLNIPAHFEGFHILRFLINYCLSHPGTEHMHFCNILVPICANHFNIENSSVYQNIRYAITIGYKNSTEYYSSLFNLKHDKPPTNVQFLKTAIKYIKNNYVSNDSLEKKVYADQKYSQIVSNILETELGFEHDGRATDILHYIIMHSIVDADFERLSFAQALISICNNKFDISNTYAETLIYQALKHSYDNYANNYTTYFGNINKHPSPTIFICTLVNKVKEF